jgi:hypothetical protein
VRRGVDHTTLRAFALAQYQVSPSGIYRAWAQQYLLDHVAEVLHATDDASHQHFIDGAVDSLQRAWRTATQARAEIDYGRAAKLLNLTLKHVALLEGLGEEERRGLYTRLHVALDRFTLAPVAALAPVLGLDRRPSMGSVRTREQYVQVQRWILEVCDSVAVPPIYYEVATFDSRRSELWYQGPDAISAARPPLHATPTAPTATPMQHAPRVRAVGKIVRDRSAPPRVDAQAKVIRSRHVERTAVLHVEGARYRRAEFDGVIELFNASDVAKLERMPGMPRVRAKLSWDGWTPPTRKHPAVSVVGRWRFERDYTGLVVDTLGRGPARTQKPI